LHFYLFLFLGFNNFLNFFSIAKCPSVLRQLTHSSPSGKLSGHSLRSLRKHLERLLEKKCVQELKCSPLAKLAVNLCPQAKSGLHKQLSCLTAGSFLPSFLMAARPNAYTSP